MKRFEFRLQAVLTLRQRAEQAAMEVFGTAIRRREAASAQLQHHEMQLSETRRQWLNEMADGCPAIRASQTLAFCHSIDERRIRADQELQQADLELAQASQRMVFARQQREAVENLLRRQREAHELQARLADQRVIDDLVNRRPLVSSAGLLQRPTWN
ncbi:MAG TPA: flagellar export protein FliJ [Verrucomicrobiae bacterium]|nr:flagellar export protein FliJ [Verrucomicrobiae bacterium]